MNDCIFCKIITGKLPAHKVYEDENVLAFMDIFPASKGHCLVIPKEHHPGFRELPEELGKYLFPVAQKIARALYEAPFSAEGINFLVSDGKTAGQEIFHLHLHVIPRYSNDKISFSAPRNKASEEELQKITEELKRKIR